MHWFNKRFNYDILIPNLEKHIYQLNEEEAAAYFTWFTEMIPLRVAYISRISSKALGVPEEKLNCSPESLVLLWKWFRNRAKTEIDSTRNPYGKELPSNAQQSNRKLTLETEYILRDIGMYLGETFRMNVPNIYWTYYTNPKRDFFVNHPLLKGFVDNTFGKPFEACFEPIHMAGVQAAKLLNKKSANTDLLDLYVLWSNKTA